MYVLSRKGNKGCKVGGVTATVSRVEKQIGNDSIKKLKEKRIYKMFVTCYLL